MKLTRKQLNQITLMLPDPRLVLRGAIMPTYKVPVFENLSIIHTDSGFSAPFQDNMKTLTFEYSEKEMDWVLTNLEL